MDVLIQALWKTEFSKFQIFLRIGKTWFLKFEIYSEIIDFFVVMKISRNKFGKKYENNVTKKFGNYSN